MGSCMVSSEGACAAHYSYGRFRDIPGGAAGHTPPRRRDVKKRLHRPLDFKHGRVDMNHGAGGRAMAQLIEELFARAFDNEWLRQGNDGALLPVRRRPPPGDGHRRHVISPLFFPGGDIGCLSVHGTVNDVAMMGARRCTWRPASSSKKAFRWPT
jgi:hydrogenase expression/formation protein HypE